MKFLLRFKKLEAGQMIPLVVLMLIGILGMVTLLLDGGAIMSNRRAAQAAADAGALAGAQRICLGRSDAVAVAMQYATVNNNATSATAVMTGKQVTVTAEVVHPSFFANIFGEETLTARATATAGCFGVRGKATVPIAWRCNPPDGGPYPVEYGCQMQTISWKLIGPMADPYWIPSSQRTTQVEISDFDGNKKWYHMEGTSIVDNNGDPPEQIYIIIDSDKICKEDSGDDDDIQCDLDGDGKKDIQTRGNRGWLFLSVGINNIADSLTGPGTGVDLKPHVWLSGKPGVTTSIYIKMDSMGYEGAVVMVPVYNAICDGDPRENAECGAAAHASPPWPPFYGDDDFSQMNREGQLNYHIITFAPFYISCIDKNGNCPGLQSSDLDKTDKKTPVMEGFFLTDVDVSASDQDCSIDLGNCIISISN